MKLAKPQVFLCLILFLIPLVCGAELFGYAEARGFWLDGVADEDNMKYITMERLRPTLTSEVESLPHTSLTVTPQVFFQQGRNHPEIQEMDDYLTVERLYLDSYFKTFDVRIGRQAVNWGSAQIWNPTDLFREVFLTDYWAERKGINALKVYAPLPQSSRVTVVAATGDDTGTENRYGVKVGKTWGETDAAAVFMDDTVLDRLVWGLDVKGQIKIGYWLEAAWFAPKDDSLDGHVEAVIGADYSFPIKSGLLAQVQYYHDGSGQKFREDYDWMAMLDNTRFGLAQDYASLAASLAWNDELSLALMGISNLNDGTWVVTPYVNLILPRDIQVSLGANLTLGTETGEFRPGEDPEELTDDPIMQLVMAEYLQEVPDAIYYIWLRWSY